MFLRGPSGETTSARRQRIARRSSILDFILDDSRRLRDSIGLKDRLRLDEYLDGIRDIERRIENLEKLEELERDEGTMSEISSTAPSGISEHVQLMHQLIILALRLDLTRVATFMWANEGSNRAYPHLDVREGHHTLTHHKGNQQQVDQIRTINRWQVEEFAQLVKQMSAVRDGEQSLLDSTALVFGSAIGDGNRHNHDNLPVLVAGRGNGLIDPGRHLAAAANTPMCNLFLTMAQAHGATVDRFGDSTAALGGLTL